MSKTKNPFAIGTLYARQYTYPIGNGTARGTKFYYDNAMKKPACTDPYKAIRSSQLMTLNNSTYNVVYVPAKRKKTVQNPSRIFRVDVNVNETLNRKKYTIGIIEIDVLARSRTEARAKALERAKRKKFNFSVYNISD